MIVQRAKGGGAKRAESQSNNALVPKTCPYILSVGHLSKKASIMRMIVLESKFMQISEPTCHNFFVPDFCCS